MYFILSSHPPAISRRSGYSATTKFLLRFTSKEMGLISGLKQILRKKKHKKRPSRHVGLVGWLGFFTFFSHPSYFLFLSVSVISISSVVVFRFKFVGK